MQFTVRANREDADNAWVEPEDRKALIDASATGDLEPMRLLTATVALQGQLFLECLNAYRTYERVREAKSGGAQHNV